MYIYVYVYIHMYEIFHITDVIGIFDIEKKLKCIHIYTYVCIYVYQ